MSHVRTEAISPMISAFCSYYSDFPYFWSHHTVEISPMFKLDCSTKLVMIGASQTIDGKQSQLEMRYL